MPMTGLRWKHGLGLLGGLGILSTTAALTHSSASDCGMRVLGRWSLPYITGVSIVGVLSVTMLILAAILPEDAAHQFMKRLFAILIGASVSLLALDATMRVTSPPRILQSPFYENHESLGYFFSPNTRHRIAYPQHGFRDVFVTDSTGLIVRGESNEPQPEATRVMFLGDSFVAGLQVAPEDNLSVKTIERLEAATGESYQGFNLGVDMYAPLQYLLAYRTFAPDLDPHIVVVVVYIGNDFEDSIALVLGERVIYDEQGEPIAIRPPIDEDNEIWVDPQVGRVPIEEARTRVVSPESWRRGLLRTVSDTLIVPLCQQLQFSEAGEVEIDPASVPLNTEAERKYANRNEARVRDYGKAIFKDTYSAQDLADLNLALSALRYLKQETEVDNRQLLLVVMPLNHQIPGQSEPLKPRRGLAPGEVITATSPQDLLADFCEDENLECLDLLPVFKTHSDEPLYWNDESHLTPVGHERAAEAIAQRLLDSP